MNSNWTGHQGVGVRGMVAARRGKKSHFGTCPGATGETGLEFPASLVRFVLCSGNMDHVYLMICTNLIQFVALCNQSVSGIHVQLQKTASFCMLIARLLDEDIHASHIFLQSECIKVTICNI